MNGGANGLRAFLRWLERRGAAITVGVMANALLLSVGAIVTQPTGAGAAAIAIDEDAGSRSHRRRPEQLQFAVVHGDDETPVVGAKVSVRMYGDRPNINRDLTTDEQGVAVFDYPDGDAPVYLWATVQHRGLVPYYVGFGNELIPATLPTAKTIRMDRGKKIGGTIAGPDGKPVAGAKVSILVPATDTPRSIHYHLLYETTGEDGKWLLDGAPLTLNGLMITIEHPHFIISRAAVQDRLDAQYVLDPGLELRGQVVDHLGKPIPDAHITVARDRWGSMERPVAVAEDGSYIVTGLEPQTTLVTAEASGYAPLIKSIQLDRNLQPLDFELLPGHITRFKVVDRSGDPLPGVRIVADTWNGSRTLWWNATTDADGMATWSGAPAEAVEFHVLGGGYAAQRDVVVTPQDEPHVVRMVRPLRIQGLVTDAKQKKIDEFRVKLGRKHPGSEKVSWISHEGTIGRNGKFEMTYRECCDDIYFRIEASGFRPWTSKAIALDKVQYKVFARLEKNPGPADAPDPSVPGQSF